VSQWPRAVVFDLDGTLADSFGAITEALNFGLAALGEPTRELEWVKHHVGRGAAELLRDALGHDAAEDRLRAVGHAFSQRYREIYLKNTLPMPGAQKVLTLVHEATGGKVGVVSNKHAALCRDWLRYWDLLRYVATVSGPDTAGARKPDPGALRPVLATLGVDAADALLVGDMEVDVETGRATGLRVVVIAGPSRSREELAAAGADAILADLRELPAWLAEHTAGPQ
jgi:phosphoglycolate phosphatase